jgi:hypothetical protein
MSATVIHAEALPEANFPSGVDTHWETVNRTMWNERERVREERELVYEISWIAEQLAIVEDLPKPHKASGRDWALWHSSGFVGNPGGFVSAKPFLA